MIVGLLAGAALASEARAQGGRILNVGGTTVVLARAGGRYQGAQLPRAAAAPRFRALTADTRATLLRTGEEVLAAAPGGALNRVSVLPNGVSLVTLRSARALPPEVTSRVTAPAFRPLSAAVKARIIQAASVEAGPAAEPAQPAAETPFTLTPMAMWAAGRGHILLKDPEFVGGMFSGAYFNYGKGMVKVSTAGATARKFMVHFQVFNPTRATYDYNILSGDGTTTKVSAQSGGTQDIVVFVNFPTATGAGTLADISGGAPQWCFVGVEVTPM